MDAKDANLAKAAAAAAKAANPATAAAATAANPATAAAKAANPALAAKAANPALAPQDRSSVARWSRPRVDGVARRRVIRAPDESEPGNAGPGVPHAIRH